MKQENHYYCKHAPSAWR